APVTLKTRRPPELTARAALMPNKVGGLLATSQLEVCDAGTPVESTVSLQVFRRVPHGAIVGWIHAEVTVITPATKRSQLRPATIHNRSLGQIQSAQGIAGRSAGKPN